MSISVEHLFSSSKHTLCDGRVSLTSVLGAKVIVSKLWLREGLGKGVNYLDGVATHCTCK